MRKQITPDEVMAVQAEGFDAAVTSWASHGNPYEVGTDEADAWEQGYNEGIYWLATER